MRKTITAAELMRGQTMCVGSARLAVLSVEHLADGSSAVSAVRYLTSGQPLTGRYIVAGKVQVVS